MRDERLRTPRWDPRLGSRGADTKIRVLALLNIPLAIWYFSWLLQPERIGHPVLYGLLLAAEVFNLAQAMGFWWTCSSSRIRPPRATNSVSRVDVFIPVCGEDPEIVEATVAAAVALRGADIRVSVLDDGSSPEIESLAARYGAGYLRRPERRGAKAGNINDALARTDRELVAVFDCDHVPDPRFLEATLGYFDDQRVAFVQTPQYYANAGRGGVAAAAFAQQALFFGPIARGKDGLGAMFCCGTNVVFRRTALESVGGFPEESVTEDFELSIRLHEQGWTSAYVSEVLAAGLGPEDMASYVSQQFRWARGCVSSLPRIFRARLPTKVRVQYALSSMFFLSGWTLLVYITMPLVRLLTGAQPLDATTANNFLLHFSPYFLTALAAVSVAGAGAYTFGAFCLMAATFWVHVRASVAALLRLPQRFVVTAKRGSGRRQPRAVLPALVAIGLLTAAAARGLAVDRGPATLNNVAFAALHVTVLLRGAWPALSGERRARPQAEVEPSPEPIGPSSGMP